MNSSIENKKLLDKVLALWAKDPQLSEWASTTFKNVGKFNLDEIKRESKVKINIDFNK